MLGPGAEGDNRTMEFEDADKRPAKVIRGRYEIIKRVGKGSFGTVYACRDYYLGNATVALKIFPPQVLHDPVSMSRLAGEIQAANRVDHENVVRFYDFFKYSDFCAITMEYVDGPSLRKYTERAGRMGSLPYELIIDIARQLCRGLQAIHAHGIVHRDLKPDNILMARDSFPKITDFGIATLSGESVFGAGVQNQASSDRGGKRRGANIIGTGRYISPESAEFNIYDFRADLYAFGVILFELITGRFFFQYKNFNELMRLKIKYDAPPPETIRPDCPEGLSRVCIKALQRNADNRYQTVAEILHDLQAIRRPQSMMDADAAAISRVTRHQRQWRRIDKLVGFVRQMPYSTQSTKALLFVSAALLVSILLALFSRPSPDRPAKPDFFDESGSGGGYEISVSVDNKTSSRPAGKNGR